MTKHDKRDNWGPNCISEENHGNDNPVHRRGYGDAIYHPNTYADLDAHPHSHRDADGHTNEYTNDHIHPHAVAHTDSNGYAYPVAHTDGNGYAHTDSNSDGEGVLAGVVQRLVREGQGAGGLGTSAPTSTAMEEMHAHARSLVAGSALQSRPPGHPAHTFLTPAWIDSIISSNRKEMPNAKIP